MNENLSLQIQLIENKIKRLEKQKNFYLDLIGERENSKSERRWFQIRIDLILRYLQSSVYRLDLVRRHLQGELPTRQEIITDDSLEDSTDLIDNYLETLQTEINLIKSALEYQKNEIALVRLHQINEEEIS